MKITINNIIDQHVNMHIKPTTWPFPGGLFLPHLALQCGTLTVYAWDLHQNLCPTLRHRHQDNQYQSDPNFPQMYLLFSSRRYNLAAMEDLLA